MTVEQWASGCGLVLSCFTTSSSGACSLQWHFFTLCGDWYEFWEMQLCSMTISSSWWKKRYPNIHLFQPQLKFISLFKTSFKCFVQEFSDHQWRWEKKPTQCLSLLYQCSPSVPFENPTLFFSHILHWQHAPPPPAPRHSFNRASYLTLLTSLLHFTHCTSSFYFMNSQVIYLCCVSACSLLSSARKWRKLRVEHGSGQLFDHTTLKCCS